MKSNHSILDFKPIVRNIKTNDLYLHLGDNNFRNIRTGKEGVISDELASSVLKINMAATQIINEYPLVEKLIEKLGLKWFPIN